ncbi:MAG: hypothetical protein V4631_00950 [Pseudomonadota bacterium]
MSQFRLARTCLILAALGMNAVPSLLISAQAQDKPAATLQKIRPEIFKLLDGAAINPLLAAKKFPEVQANIAAAEAFTDRSPSETYMLNRVKLQLGSASNDNAITMPALEALINSGFVEKREIGVFIQILAEYNLNAKNFPKAIEWFKRYEKEGLPAETVRPQLSRAYYQSGDYANTKVELLKIIGAAEAAGKKPEMDDLRLLNSTEGLLKDMPAYTATLEKLVTLYPTEKFWTEMLNRLMLKPGFRSGLKYELYRLELVALKDMTPEAYVDMAEQSLQEGLFAEAKQVMDAGYDKGILGKGASAAKHKEVRAKADKGAADDAKNVASGDASAVAAKTGQPQVNLGYVYVTMGQFDKGIAMIEKGIAKGGLKHPEDAKLRLGVSLVKADRKADAIKVFQDIKGNDGVADLARYWTMFLNRPAGPMPAAPPATIK